jgi:hypothetical protein
MKVKVRWDPAYYLSCCTFSVALQAQMFSIFIVLQHIVQSILFSFSALDSLLYSPVYQKVKHVAFSIVILIIKNQSFSM